MISALTLRRHEAWLLALAGLLQTLAFVHTWAWPLPLVTVALLVARLNTAKPLRAAWLGWCYGTAWIAGGTWWMFISMNRYGSLPAPLAALAVFALAAALALYLALACGLYARWRRGRLWRDAALFAALWLLAELARARLFTGFPWLASGYSQVDAPLAWAAPWIGVYGIGALMAWIAAAAAAWRRESLVALLMLTPALLPVPAFTETAGSFSVTLVQTNVPQDQKFRVERLPEDIARTVAELSANKADLIVAPETVIPLLPQQLAELAPGGWDALLKRYSTGTQAALFGVPLGNEREGYTNSVIGLSATNAAHPYRYDKHHLVPFGEFIPPAFRWFTQMMNIPLGDFARGAVVQASFEHKGQRLAPNICYEDLFGEELALRFAVEEKAPTAFVNVSNIGWFGDTVAVPQHLNISRLRSLEFQRPMLRATNTGATAVIDHRGRVQAMLPPFTRGQLNATVEGRKGLTPYAMWVPQTPLWLVALAVLGLLLVRRSVDPRRGAGG